MKNLSRYIIIILAILVAELVSAYILLITAKYKAPDSPYQSALVQMFVAVITFYPTVLLVEKYMKSWSKSYLDKMQKVTSSKLLGLLMGFVLAVLLILMAMVKVIYNRSMIEDVWHWLQNVI
ncbi:MAG TPA: hypothetical protein VNB90_00400 [Cytophagaceae bacterium]|nr:hypothetical protein [Cytophagaceae bacterium]